MMTNDALRELRADPAIDRGERAAERCDALARPRPVPARSGAYPPPPFRRDAPPEIVGGQREPDGPETAEHKGPYPEHP